MENEKKTEKTVISEEQFQQDLNEAMGLRAPQPLPAALQPTQVQLPDMERWLGHG